MMPSLPTASHHQPNASRHVIAPYITAWTAEQEPPTVLVERPSGGIAYEDETLADRDRNDVLWFRTPHLPGHGRPDFGRVHPTRQRRAMQRLLCQVCAGPADTTDDGVLWLLKDHREDWPSWPNGMGVTEPPICVPCIQISIRLCPALRKGAAMVRAGSFVLAGAYGMLYKVHHKLVAVGPTTIPFEDPTIRWLRAINLVRELQDCAVVPFAP